MNLYIILSIIFVHWVADFVIQTDEEAKGKSTSFLYLIQHTGKYSILFIPFILLITINQDIGSSQQQSIKWLSTALQFGFITFIFHTITDYFTSRLNSKLWKKGDVHNFFVSIGFDQVLHYVQLFLTYKLLIG